jgi:hypothetical protein
MGAADTISVVIRVSLVQLMTPDDLRGKVGAINYLFINASNQLGGLGTVAVALLWMMLFPALRRVDRLE